MATLSLINRYFQLKPISALVSPNVRQNQHQCGRHPRRRDYADVLLWRSTAQEPDCRDEFPVAVIRSNRCVTAAAHPVRE
jgi:hypothetical protein